MTAPGKLSGGQCETVADDGQRCQRVPHPENPNAHDFTVQSGIPVDGGRNWREWIRAVHAVRESLLLRVVKDGVASRESDLNEWAPSYCREVLAEIAEHVGLTVERDASLGPVKITEPGGE